MPAERYHTVARVGDFIDGQGRVVEVDGRMIAIFFDNGAYYAVDDLCPHQGASLAEGLICEKSVTCTWHGWRFSLEDGRNLDGTQARVAIYPVRVMGDEVQVGVA